MTLLSLILVLFSSTAWAQDDAWQATLERVVPAVVSVKVVGTRSFDTESAGNSYGTGFVVDAERGILLTNRHMVHAGPVVAEAVFLNDEEVPLQAIYRDPVHDFGFYRFDPADLRHMELVELPLYPQGAQVGAEIRVVGNDAGEKVVILDGTIARLDRDAPYYGGNTYNDFNTFYLQAGSGTSGGSSGSPVVDSEGRVIALNAGGKRSSASSFYLPLDRIVRALELLQQGQDVPRGTLETMLLHTPYDELRRLGLQADTEAEMRATFPDGDGLLVVRQVVPGGPADGVLKVGDVVTHLLGEPVDSFLALESTLDDAVDQTVALRVQRDGEILDLELRVQDLHAITPSEFLEFGGGVLHALSYQQARNYALPVQGLYVAAPGYALGRAGIPDSALILEVDGQPVADLDALEAALSPLADGSRVSIRYAPINNLRDDRVTSVVVDRTWNRMQRCVRDDATGTWPCVASPAPADRDVQQPRTVSMTADGPKAVQAVAPSLVMVEYDIPVRAEGVSGDNFRGAGLVVDAEQGLVIADRDTVPILLGQAELVFAASVRVPAQVVFVHPVHNLSVLRYDPALLGDTPVQSAVLVPGTVEEGDALWLVGLTSDGRVLGRETDVTRVDPLELPLPRPPQFRETNVDTAQLSETVSTVGGVVADKKGRVHGLWSSVAYRNGGGDRHAFLTVEPTDAVLAILPDLQAGVPVSRRDLGVELGTLPLAEARDLGLDEALATQLAETGSTQVLTVKRAWAGTPASDALRGGDLIVRVNGQPVSHFAQVEDAAQSESVALTVARGDQVLELQVGTVPLAGRSVDHVALWAGLLLHDPHHEVAAQQGLEPSGVYVADYFYGSPGHRYKLRATWRIVEVNGEPVADLDAFLDAVSDLPDGASVKVTVQDLQGQPMVRTMTLDTVYWPAQEFRYADGAWSRVE
jgi:S1-C subfamily serine protease